LVVRWVSLKVDHWGDDWAGRLVASSAEMKVACWVESLAACSAGQ
jgi:hypothetical protein